MFGLIKRYARVALLGIVFFAATLTIAGVANPGHAAAAGTIKGGKLFFNITVNGDTQKVPISNETTKVTLSPAVPGASTNVGDGTFEITNVPAGTYSVTVAFSLTKGACSQGNWLERIGRFTPIGAIYCNIKGDNFYNGSKVFGAVKVQDGQVTFVGGSEDTSDKVIGNAIQTDENGNPKLNCQGGFVTEWVICPMIENMFGAMDFALTNVIKPFLAVAPLTPTDSSGNTTPLYTIWDNIRNIVNIGFILIFFIIIFSQATSIGVSNYGVKKLLPKLIGIAILTNLSFYVCAILIDVSNILGAGVTSLATSAVLNGQPTVDLSGDYLLDAAVLSAVPIALVAAPIAIPAVFIFIIIAFIIFIIAAFCILLRQIILIFLIVIAPLAMIAGILPNTSRYASEWFSLFARLLLMYPLIMLLFALGKIASSVLTQVGGIGG